MNDLISNSRKSRLWLEYCGVLFIAGFLYILTMAPGTVWQDNGMIQVRVLQHDYVGKLGLALAHPLFYLVAQAFQFLPLSESALKTNLVAVVAATFTVANFYLLLRILLSEKASGRLASVVGALGLALAHTFWQHAALPETYTLSTAILSLELILLVRFFQTGRIHWWLLMFFFNGVECSNHMLATVTLAPVLLWSLFLVYNRKIKLYWFLPAAALWILGCLPYEFLGFRAWQNGTPLPEVLKSMLFGDFQREVLNVSLNMKLIVTTLGVIALNFFTPNILLIPAGMVRAGKFLPTLLILLFGLLTGFHLIFAMRYPIRDQYTFFIIPVFFLAVWLGIGAAWFMERFPRKSWLPVAFAFLPPLGYVFLPAVVQWRNPHFAHPPIPYRDEAQYFFWPWKTGYNGPERLVHEVFELAGPNAVIQADSTAIRPFQYIQLTQNLRPDLTIVGSLYDDVPEDRRVELLTQTLATREVFIIRPYKGYAPAWILENFKLEPVDPIFQVLSPASR